MRRSLFPYCMAWNTDVMAGNAAAVLDTGAWSLMTLWSPNISLRFVFLCFKSISKEPFVELLSIIFYLYERKEFKGFKF